MNIMALLRKIMAAIKPAVSPTGKKPPKAPTGLSVKYVP